jgi:hypothetical protein
VVISYETATYRRRFVFEYDRLIQGRSFLKEGERGEVYRGKVLEKIEGLGYLIDLGPFKGLCQEKVHLGAIETFEILKRQEDKHPLVTRSYGLMGESLILRAGQSLSFSREIPTTYRGLLEELDLSGVYFRREALKKPLYQVRKEYDELRQKQKEIEIKNQLGLVHRPPFKEEGDSYYFMELEEKILRLRRGKIDDRGIVLFFEPTRAGLVIDVNGVGKEEELNNTARDLIEESLILMNVGGLVIIDLVGTGKGYGAQDSLTKEGVLVQSLPVRGANLFYTPLKSLEQDYEELRHRLSKEF